MVNLGAPFGSRRVQPGGVFSGTGPSFLWLTGGHGLTIADRGGISKAWMALAVGQLVSWAVIGHRFISCRLSCLLVSRDLACAQSGRIYDALLVGWVFKKRASRAAALGAVCYSGMSGECLGSAGFSLATSGSW